MKFKSIKTGEVVASWDETTCNPYEYGSCDACPIHEHFDRLLDEYEFCSDIVEKYPEAARLIGYEPVYDTPQPESGMDAKLLDLFKQMYNALHKTSFCYGIRCDKCPFNTPEGQPCGANQIIEAMETMAGASELEF